MQPAVLYWSMSVCRITVCVFDSTTRKIRYATAIDISKHKYLYLSQYRPNGS